MSSGGVLHIDCSLVDSSFAELHKEEVAEVYELMELPYKDG
jgi:hypothetical protein